jgi:hypothetical protein
VSRRKLPAITDTAGNEIPRICFASLQQVLDTPVNVTAIGPCDYALVSCGVLGAYLSRRGRTIQKAVFAVTTLDPETYVTAEGAEGRDFAINYFLGLLKKRKSFWPERSKIDGTQVVEQLPAKSPPEPLDDTFEQLDRLVGSDG